MKLKVLDNILSNFLPEQYFFRENNLKKRNSITSVIFEQLNFELEFVKENEVSDFNDIFYPIVNLNNLNTNNQDVFSDDLKKYIKKGLKVIIFHLNECFHEDDIFSFNQYCLNNYIDTSKIYLYVNNKRIENYLSDMKSNINFYFPFYQSIEHSKILQKKKVEYSDKDKSFLFMCHNNKMWNHRLSTIVLLKENNLLEKVDYSCIDFSVSDDSDSFIKALKSDSKTFIDSYDSIIEEGSKLSFYEKDKFQKNEIDSGIIDVNTFKNSYVNIVTETDFTENVIHITEKSLKPFYYYQIPLIVAPYNHLKALREIYDFDFFDDLIDHSYDYEKNPVKRIKLIFNEINKIKNNPDVIKDFYKWNKDRFINNNKIVCEIVNKTDDTDYTKNIFI